MTCYFTVQAIPYEDVPPTSAGMRARMGNEREGGGYGRGGGLKRGVADMDYCCTTTYSIPIPAKLRFHEYVGLVLST